MDLHDLVCVCVVLFVCLFVCLFVLEGPLKKKMPQKRKPPSF